MLDNLVYQVNNLSTTLRLQYASTHRLLRA